MIAYNISPVFLVITQNSLREQHLVYIDHKYVHIFRRLAQQSGTYIRDLVHFFTTFLHISCVLMLLGKNSNRQNGSSSTPFSHKFECSRHPFNSCSTYFWVFALNMDIYQVITIFIYTFCCTFLYITACKYYLQQLFQTSTQPYTCQDNNPAPQSILKQLFHTSLWSSTHEEKYSACMDLHLQLFDTSLGSSTSQEQF